jgi:uncharacterized protein (TIGR03435 family)
MRLRAFLFLCIPAILAGQQPSRLTFEVASVKALPYTGVDTTGPRSTGMAPPLEGDPAQISYIDVSLVGVLCRAYNLLPAGIRAPEWMSSRRYSIMAKVPADAPKGHLGEMLQNLLADRFQMKLHWEQKKESGYSLTVTKGGPKLKESAPGAARTLSMQSNGHLQWMASTMDDFAASLTVDMGAPVVNWTELPATYDISLDAVPNSMPGFHFGGGQDSSFPTILAALRELGLNLAAGKVTVKYLVVDSALKVPTEN